MNITFKIAGWVNAILILVNGFTHDISSLKGISLIAFSLGLIILISAEAICQTIKEKK